MSRPKSLKILITLPSDVKVTKRVRDQYVQLPSWNELIASQVLYIKVNTWSPMNYENFWHEPSCSRRQDHWQIMQDIHE